MVSPYPQCCESVYGSGTLEGAENDDLNDWPLKASYMRIIAELKHVKLSAGTHIMFIFCSIFSSFNGQT